MIVDVQEGGGAHRPRPRRTVEVDVIVALKGAVALLFFLICGYALHMKLENVSEEAAEAMRRAKELIGSARKETAEVAASLALINEEVSQLKQRLGTCIGKDDVLDLLRGAGDATRKELITHAEHSIVSVKTTVAKQSRVQEDMLKVLNELQMVDSRAKFVQIEASLSELRRMLGIHNVPQPPASPINVNAVSAVSPGSVQQAESYAQYLPPSAPDIPDPWLHKSEEERNSGRQKKVKEEFMFSWNAYKKYAWGNDELCPLSKSYKNWGGWRSKGLALTAVDAMSTLWLMDLKDEFHEAVELIVNKVSVDQDIRVSAFETTIRFIGGLLSAFELSGEHDRRLVKMAQDMMDRVLVAFNTTTAVPHQTLNLRQKTHWSPDWTAGAAVLSEFGSIQLELRTLSYHTQNPVYDMKATHQMSVLRARCPADLLCPTMFDVFAGEFRDDHVTLGALGDSFYEYLLKQFLLTGKTEPQYRKMTLTALESILGNLVKYSHPSRQAYIAERIGGQLDHKMDELACFAGGMFALAAMALPDSGSAKAFERTAKDLTETCYTMFKQQATGIAPEIVDFPYGRDMTPSSPYYLLRPETCESIFYMWRLTKLQRYRDMQWFIFSHIMQHCRVDTGGYCGIRNVNVIPAELDDLQQSFWLSETLKYIYLTFGDDNLLDLKDWVFNTEAHPLKIRKRDPLDIWRAWEIDHDGTMPWYPPTLDGVVEVETERMQSARKEAGVKRVAPVDPLSVYEPPEDDANFNSDAYRAQMAERAAAADHQPSPPTPPLGVERQVEKIRHDKLRQISQRISSKINDASNDELDATE